MLTTTRKQIAGLLVLIAMFCCGGAVWWTVSYETSQRGPVIRTAPHGTRVRTLPNRPDIQGVPGGARVKTLPQAPVIPAVPGGVRVKTLPQRPVIRPDIKEQEETMPQTTETLLEGDVAWSIASHWSAS